jgi:hypothetical protein
MGASCMPGITSAQGLVVALSSLVFLVPLVLVLVLMAVEGNQAPIFQLFIRVRAHIRTGNYAVSSGLHMACWGLWKMEDCSR